jgi:hypothetical protein
MPEEYPKVLSMRESSGISICINRDCKQRLITVLFVPKNGHSSAH